MKYRCKIKIPGFQFGALIDSTFAFTQSNDPSLVSFPCDYPEVFESISEKTNVEKWEKVFMKMKSEHGYTLLALNECKTLAEFMDSRNYNPYAAYAELKE